MNKSGHNFDAYSFSKQPDYNEAEVRRAFAKAAPLKTVVVYCYDPRVTGIPKAVADELGDVFPGDVLTGENGNKVATTTTMFEVIVAGGRATDALRSVTVAQHLFGIENVVIVHHSHCGATSFTADGIIDAYRHEHGLDISNSFPRDSICISDYVSSLQHDVRLVRESPGTPEHVNVFGYFYDIDTEQLTRVVDDPASVKRVVVSS